MRTDFAGAPVAFELREDREQFLDDAVRILERRSTEHALQERSVLSKPRT